MNKLSTGKLFYLCCFLFIGFVSSHVSASSQTVDQLIKSFDSFEVDGLSLTKKESDIVGILNSKGYKLKNKKKNDSRYLRVEEKKRYKATVKTSLKNGGVEYLLYSFLTDINPEFIKSEKARIAKVFDGFARACVTKKSTFRCSALTDTNVVAITAVFYKKHVQYTLVNRPDTKARLITAQRKHASTHKKHEEEQLVEKERARKEKEINDAAATKAYRKEMVERREQRSEASLQKMMEENRQLSEKRKKHIEAMGEREKKAEERMYRLYYEKTPEREKSKYSANEHKLMKNGKLAVPANYAAPTAEEIRLAVMRSIIDRADDMVGKPYAEAQRRRNKGSVITDGKKIFLEIDNIGTQVIFQNASNVSCSKRSGHTGYICRYALGSSASAFGDNSLVRAMESELSYSPGKTNNDWFILTATGWRQPHTDEQKAAIEKMEARANQLIRDRNARRYDNVSTLDRAAQELGDGMYIKGAQLGTKIKKLR